MKSEHIKESVAQAVRKVGGGLDKDFIDRVVKEILDNIDSPRYVYSFNVRLRNNSKWSKHIVDLFTMFERTQMDFTEHEFSDFRVALEQAGFHLREVERVPYHIPERVP